MLMEHRIFLMSGIKRLFGVYIVKGFKIVSHRVEWMVGTGFFFYGVKLWILYEVGQLKST